MQELEDYREAMNQIFLESEDIHARCIAQEMMDKHAERQTISG